MTAKYYSGRLAPVGTWNIQGEDPDYPVTHVVSPRLARPWRSDGLLTSRVRLDFGASIYIDTLVVCDVNLPRIRVWTGQVDWNENLLPAMYTVTNEITQRGHVVVPIAGSWRYVSIGMELSDMGSVLYGNSGAAYAYASVTTLPKSPRYGFKMERIRPDIPKELPNGVVQTLVTGTDYTKLNGSFKGTASDDIMGLLNAAQQETVFLDLDIANRPGLAWPVELAGNTVARNIDHFNREVTPFNLREVV